MLYKYKALNSHGKSVKGEMEAQSSTELKKILRQQKLILVKAIRKEKISLKNGFFKKVKTKDIAVFTRGLSTMVNAGVGLIRCFEILEMQIENPKLKVSRIADDELNDKQKEFLLDWVGDDKPEKNTSIKE